MTRGCSSCDDFVRSTIFDGKNVPVLFFIVKFRIAFKYYSFSNRRNIIGSCLDVAERMSLFFIHFLSSE